MIVELVVSKRWFGDWIGGFEVVAIKFGCNVCMDWAKFEVERLNWILSSGVSTGGMKLGLC